MDTVMHTVLYLVANVIHVYAVFLFMDRFPVSTVLIRNRKNSGIYRILCHWITLMALASQYHTQCGMQSRSSDSHRAVLPGILETSVFCNGFFLCGGDADRLDRR